ncbi:hypothetical protein [Salegentibacter sp. T436]|uniref:hypothetical protein n=1 Tax=Salegentibacter sp. T436 TaxID=1729720 RepID=UPI00094A1CE6|nr:hypothetical protein [Salegentibacter sp. T436]APS40603.1 hypothetical protein AO058_17735 [Salegentibacter sp. T436]
MENFHLIFTNLFKDSRVSDRDKNILKLPFHKSELKGLGKSRTTLEIEYVLKDNISIENFVLRFRLVGGRSDQFYFLINEETKSKIIDIEINRKIEQGDVFKVELELVSNLSSNELDLGYFLMDFYKKFSDDEYFKNYGWETFKSMHAI